MVGRPDIEETIQRLQAYADAGVACLYAPRIDTAEHVTAIAEDFAPKLVNPLINAPLHHYGRSGTSWGAADQHRRSARSTAWGGCLDAAREIAEDGTFSRFDELLNVDALLG